MSAPWYGSDPSGLISAFLFRPGEPGQALDADAVTDWLSGPAGEGSSFLWLHFDLANNATLRWLRQHLALSDSFYDALGDHSRSTRIDFDGEALVGVFNDVVYDLLQGSTDVSTLWLNLSPRMMISTRLRPLRSIDRLREAVKRRVCFGSPVGLLNHLLQDQADELAKIVRDTTSTVNSIEDHLLAGRIATHRTELGAMRRLLVRLKRLLAPEPATLFRLLNRAPHWMAEDDVVDLRHSTEEFNLAIGDLDGLLERIKLLQEELASHVSEQTNRSVFVLTMVTVLALPINLTAGLLGMNVGGIPWAQNPAGFYIVLGSVLAVSGLAAWLALRKRDA